MNKKNILPESLRSNREKGIKEELINKKKHRGKHGSGPKKNPKERICRHCNAPNWNPNYKCPAQESTYHNCRKDRLFAKTCTLENRKQ